MKEGKSIDSLNAYNRIAGIYDPLSRWVLGRDFIQSKQLYADRIKRGSTVLILGGGTGENLPEMLKRVGSQGELYFMEASSAMIKKAKDRFHGSLPGSIHFIHNAEFNELNDVRPDYIITHYFLDVLPDKQLEALFSEVDKIAKPQNEWIFADFYPVSQKRMMIQTIIWFFRLFVRHPRKDLPIYENYFEQWGWKEKETCSYMDGFIQAKVYQKASSLDLVTT